MLLKPATIPAALLCFLAVLPVLSCGQSPRLSWRYVADIDLDGVPDSVEVRDLNANGSPDLIGDLHLFTAQGSLRAALWTETESDLDGEPDEMRIFIDRNLDGVVDTSEGWLWRMLDLDDDGICNDRDSDLHELDLAGRGFPVQRIRYQDSDGDGDGDIRVDYPTQMLNEEDDWQYIVSNRCMRETWMGMFHNFGAWLYADDDDDNRFPAHVSPFLSVWNSMDVDGAGTNVMRHRRPRAPTGDGVEGRHTTGEAHRWYDLDGDGFTDMHLRDYGPGMMRWSFDWDGDSPQRFRLDDPLGPVEAHVDFDVAFHTLGVLNSDWGAGDQLRLWDFSVGAGLPELFRQPGTAFDFGSDYVPASSAVYYTLHAPWQAVSLTWIEDQQDAGRTKDVGCNRLEGIWSFYQDFGPRAAFIGSRRDFDRDADSGFKIYRSPIDSLYHLYEAEDGIFYRDPQCRRDRFSLRPTPENIAKYVAEIITYSDSDNDGFFDTFAYDRNLDGIAEDTVFRPDGDQAELTDFTEAWRLGAALDSLYYPGAEDSLPVEFAVDVQWRQAAYELQARVSLSSSRALEGYQLWFRAGEHVDNNILFRHRLSDGRSGWQFSETIPRAQFILPGPTRVTALLVNNVGRIVGRRDVAPVAVEPLNSPVMYVGHYRAWKGSAGRDTKTLTLLGREAKLSAGELLKLEVGFQSIAARESGLEFEPYLTDETEVPRWPLGRKSYRVSTGEYILAAEAVLVPYGEEVLRAAGGRAGRKIPLSLDSFLGVREQGDRVYIPPGKAYRLGFRIYLDGRLIEDRVLYYDWLADLPLSVRVD